MKGSDECRRPAIVRTTLEAVYAFMHVLAPVIPFAAQAVFDRLGTPPRPLSLLRSDLYNLKPGTPVTLGEILFQKIEADESQPVQEKVGKLVGKKALQAQAITAQSEEDPNQVDFTKLDIRVGRIVKVWNHETAERLYCEEIDVGDGDGKTRPVASGLRQYYSLGDLEDRLVVVVCNLKETKLQGFMSYGMVLVAKVGNAVETSDARMVLLEPPKGAAVGDRVYVAGLQEGNVGGGAPLPAARIKKLKVICWQEMTF
jgi:methionine--tRNA ligase beta chain